MNTMTISKWCKACLIAAAVVSAPVAIAGPSPASPEMRAALAKAAQGPDQLRWYVQRTKSIYALDFDEVMLVLHPEQTANVETTVVVANNATR